MPPKKRAAPRDPPPSPGIEAPGAGRRLRTNRRAPVRYGAEEEKQPEVAEEEPQEPPKRKPRQTGRAPKKPAAEEPDDSDEAEEQPPKKVGRAKKGPAPKKVAADEPDDSDGEEQAPKKGPRSKKPPKKPAAPKKAAAKKGKAAGKGQGKGKSKDKAAVEDADEDEAGDAEEEEASKQDDAWRTADPRPELDGVMGSEDVLAELYWTGSKSALERYKVFPGDVEKMITHILHRELPGATERSEVAPILNSMVANISVPGQAADEIVQKPDGSPVSGKDAASGDKNAELRLSLYGSTPAPISLEASYVKVKKLGNGSNGNVFMYKERQTGRLVAVKQHIVDPEADGAKRAINKLAKLPAEKARAWHREQNQAMYREIKWMYKFEHDNILKPLGHAFDKGHIWYMMPLYTGSLSNFEDELRSLVAEVSPEGSQIHKARKAFSLFSWDMWTSMLSACAYLHDEAKVVHLDIKPDNILWKRLPTTKSKSKGNPDTLAFHWVLADFGSVEPVGDLFWEENGTPFYRAPENRNWPYGVDSLIDPSADVWSLYQSVAELFANPNIKKKTHKCEPLGPWFGMREVNAKSRPTMKMALDLTKDLTNRWGKFIPEWWTLSNGEDPDPDAFVGEPDENGEKENGGKENGGKGNGGEENGGRGDGGIRTYANGLQGPPRTPGAGPAVVATPKADRTVELANGRKGKRKARG